MPKHARVNVCKCLAEPRPFCTVPLGETALPGRVTGIAPCLPVVLALIRVHPHRVCGATKQGFKRPVVGQIGSPAEHARFIKVRGRVRARIEHKADAIRRGRPPVNVHNTIALQRRRPADLRTAGSLVEPHKHPGWLVVAQECVRELHLAVAQALGVRVCHTCVEVPIQQAGSHLAVDEAVPPARMSDDNIQPTHLTHSSSDVCTHTLVCPGLGVDKCVGRPVGLGCQDDSRSANPGHHAGETGLQLGVVWA
mmetsp:Transcript_31415/g.60573  ORF Transcript_31415/g.60573 Transcript_31415/m.60573 type:complete len:252 (-) Transcript_31415:124-879(-)